MSLADRLRKWVPDLPLVWRRAIRSAHEREHAATPERGRSEAERADAKLAPSAVEVGSRPTVPAEPSPAPAGEPPSANEPPLAPASEKATGGTKDDLTAIRGIGLSTQARLNATGIWSFDQLAQSTSSDVRKALDSTARRAAVEKWIRQARELAGHDSK